MPKPVKLAPSYANSHGGINAYDAPDERGRGVKKEAFMTASRAILRALSAPLKQQGWTSKITASRGGVAVSGSTWCQLRHPQCEKMLMVEVVSIPQIGRQSDGAVILVQLRTNDGRNRVLGNNIWLSADLDSDQLVVELRKIIERLS